MSPNAKASLSSALIAVALLAVFHYFAPLEPTSVAAYAGAVITLCGLLSLVKPLRFVGIRTRRAALLTGVTGVVILMAALNWPAGAARVVQPASYLDRAMPEFHFHERHEVRVHAVPTATAAALRAVTFDDIGVYFALMRIRAAASGRLRSPEAPSQVKVLDALARPGSGFVLLHDDGREIVMGMAGQPWGAGRMPGIRSRDDFDAFNHPESVKIAFNLTVIDEGSGWSRIVTETRIHALDGTARRTMARYWRVIYPGSGMIRRMWLNAARDRAELPR